MDSVCLFNNKGGVGKTTLLCNVAAKIAAEYDLRVLLVDADPQCNATQLVLSETDVSHLFEKSKKTKKTKAQTIIDMLRPIGRGEPTIAKGTEPISGKSHRFCFDIIPGHPKLALLEDKFSSAWLSFEGGDFAGARQTNWIRQLQEQVEDCYDIVFFDVGPSLGALNRTVLIGTDFFVTPLSCDIFSIAGLENISEWFKQWMGSYESGLANCRKKEWGGDLDEYPIQTSKESMARFIGYTVQQYITKIRHGERRPTIAYENIRRKIPGAVDRSVQAYIRPNLKSSFVDLGDVPNMFSLVPLAQSANSPVFALEARDGINGAQYAQRDAYADVISTLAKNVLRNLDYSTGGK